MLADAVSLSSAGVNDPGYTNPGSARALACRRWRFARAGFFKKAACQKKSKRQPLTFPN